MIYHVLIDTTRDEKYILRLLGELEEKWLDDSREMPILFSPTKNEMLVTCSLDKDDIAKLDAFKFVLEAVPRCADQGYLRKKLKTEGNLDWSSDPLYFRDKRGGAFERKPKPLFADREDFRKAYRELGSILPDKPKRGFVRRLLGR